MRDADTIFDDKAFDCLNEDIKNSLKILYQNIKGKPIGQGIPYIIAFVNSLPRGIQITREQKSAIIKAVTEDMSEQEKNNLMKILNMFGF